MDDHEIKQGKATREELLASFEKALEILNEVAPSIGSGSEICLLREDSRRHLHLSLRTQNGLNHKLLTRVAKDFPAYRISNHGHEPESLRWFWIELEEFNY